MDDFYHERHLGFRYQFTLENKQRTDGAVLLDKPGVCRCVIRKIGNDPELERFEWQNNYAARIRSSDDLAIEAVIDLHSPQHPQWDHLRIGIPLTEIPETRDFELIYDGINFDLFGNGRLLDEERVFGDPVATPDQPYFPQKAEAIEPEILTQKMQNWTLPSPNAWVGDVSLGYFDGKFYIFYLSGRRHHGSKFGQGGHVWGLLRTSDLKTWEHVPDILPLEAQWQTYGTGTPFLWDHKVFLTHGLHTSRFYTDHSHPEGATWAESTDGLHFTPSRTIFDLPENPSIYNVDGKLYLFQGYNTDHVNIKIAEKWSDFSKVIATGIFAGDKAPTRHSTECPAYFEWKGRHYLLVGFSGMYCSDTIDFKEPVDLAARGDSLYDGLGVPMVAPYKDDRRILAGWVRVGGWGGTLGLRELVYFPDGVPGCRWLEEVMPVFSDFLTFQHETQVTGNDFMLELLVEPGKDLTVRFEGKGKPAEFRIRAAEKKAELLFSEDRKALTILEAGHSFGSKNVAVTNLRNIDRQYRVRILGTRSRKLNGTILDVEIAGARTLIYYFGQHVTETIKLEGDAAAAKRSCTRKE